MPASDLSSKLMIEPGSSVLVLNPPDGPETPANVDPYDVVLLYSKDRAELELNAARAMAAVKPGGHLWMAYPNPGSRETDLSRDHGWGVLHGEGLVAVKQVDIDARWNALRFRPHADGAGEAVPAADILPVGRQATFAYRVVRLLSVPLLRAAFHFETHGREQIPRTGTYIVIANHLGWLDALTLAMVFPIEPRIHFLADPTGMMRRRLEWALIRATGGIVPVDRAVHRDQKLFAQVNRCLELGGAVALFPEGDFGPREGELLPFKSGFAHFAVSSGVPVVPVALSGPKDVWLGKRIRVFIGEPIPAAGRTVEEVHRLGEAAVAALLPQYREPAGRKLLRRWLTGLF
jgi:1-acyl-sn-glycerol-3-phosphate acyltransferase